MFFTVKPSHAKAELMKKLMHATDLSEHGFLQAKIHGQDLVSLQATQVLAGD